MRPQVGQVINNKYRLNRLIGDGGMGSVYEARHEMLGTLVALKFLHPELTRRTGLVQRFLQEAKVSAQIQSPHVVRVMDVDQTPDGQAFIVLEYLEGRTLQTLYEDLYKAGQRLSYADALEYSMQMIEGVEAAHKTGIVHRDLKPDNVMITTGPKGAPLLKLLDFGIAKLKVTGEMEKGLTRPGVIMGTPEYMAPEQAYSADAVDSRADIFSLGVMMFEMLAGRRPVGGDDPQQIAAAYLAGQIARLEDLAPGIAPELAAAVHKAMAALAKNRFNSVSELRDAIEPFALAVRPVQPSRVSLSATPTPGPASPSPMMASSPATNLPEEAPRAVPKTLPPDDDAPAVAHHGGPTPLGGFAALNALGPVNMAATVTTPPLAVNGFGSTDFAMPLTPLAPAAVDVSPRPGGTHVGNGGGYGGGSATAAGAPAYGAEFAGTAPMDSPYGATPGMNGNAARTVSALPPEPRRAAGRGPSLLLVLLLAVGVAGAVVGGVYAANQYAKVEDHNDVPIQIPPTSTVRSDPPPTTGTTAPIATTPVAVRPPVVTPPHATTPTTPTTPKPGTTTTPTTLPTVPTALIIPSAFPNFPNPFGLPNPFQPPGTSTTPAPQQQTPPSTPTTPPTTPAPTTTGRPKIFFPPKSGMNEAPRPHHHPITILPQRRG